MLFPYLILFLREQNTSGWLGTLGSLLKCCLCSCSHHALSQLFQALILPMAVGCCSSATLLFTLSFCVTQGHVSEWLICRAQGNPSLLHELVPETGCADKWNKAMQGALPPQGDRSISTLLILFKPTLQEVSVGKNLATPM